LHLAFYARLGLSTRKRGRGDRYGKRGWRSRRSRANLRPRSRSASVIDRLLINQNPLENCNNLRSSSPHPVLDRRPGNRAAICGPKFIDTGAGCSDRRCSVRGIRRLGEAVGGRRLARAPPRRVTRWLATSIIAPPAPALSGSTETDALLTVGALISHRVWRLLSSMVQARCAERRWG